MHQLELLPPTRQAEVILLVSSQPRLMETLAVASPLIHETVQRIAGMKRKLFEAGIKVQTLTLLDSTLQLIQMHLGQQRMPIYVDGVVAH